MDQILDIEEIRALLPHRYPILLVDRVLELEPGERVVGLKNVTINEPFFVGHFPGQAVMPGVLIAEAMAQVAGLMLLSLPGQAGKLAYLAGIDKLRFRKPVVPGDTLITESSILWVKGSIGRVKMVGRVEGVVVAEGEMMFSLRDPLSAEQIRANVQAKSRNGAVKEAAGGERVDRPINRQESVVEEHGHRRESGRD